MEEIQPLRRNTKRLLTEREVCTVKYRTEVFVLQKTGETEIRYFTVQNVTREVNKLFIIFSKLFFQVAAIILHLSIFDLFLVYYKKFNGKDFIFPPTARKSEVSKLFNYMALYLDL